MRYPIWMFMFAFVMPPFAAHALLTGKAQIEAPERRVTVTRPAATDPHRGITIAVSARGPVWTSR